MWEGSMTGNAGRERTAEWSRGQRREDAKKVAEKCTAWERKDLLFVGLLCSLQSPTPFGVLSRIAGGPLRGTKASGL